MQATRAVVLAPARAGEPGALRWANAGLDSKLHRTRTNTTDWRQSMFSLRPDHTLIRATWWALAISQNGGSTAVKSQPPDHHESPGGLMLAGKSCKHAGRGARPAMLRAPQASVCPSQAGERNSAIGTGFNDWRGGAAAARPRRQGAVAIAQEEKARRGKARARDTGF